MKKILLVFLLAIPFLGFSQQQFTNTDIVCWDSAGVVRSLVREVYKVNGIGQVVSFYDVQTNAAVTVSSGTISYCTDTTAVGVQDYECLDTITQANSFVTNSVTSVHFDGTNYVSWDTLSPTCIDGYARGINSNSFELYTCGTWSNITSYGNGSWYAHSGTVFSQTAADTVEALSFDVHGGKVTFYVTRCIKYFPANAATIYSSNIDSLYTRNDTLFVVNNDASVDTFFNYIPPVIPVGTVISPTETIPAGDSTATWQQVVNQMRDSIPEHTGTTGSVFFAGSDGKPTEDNANLFWDDVNNRLRINNSTGTYDVNILGKLLIENNATEHNISIGRMSLENIAATGIENIGIGLGSFKSLTTGDNNVGVGVYTGFSTATASNNTFVGHSSGLTNTASFNTAIGSSALQNVTTGGSNVAIGRNAGKNRGAVFDGVFIGDGAGENNVGSGTVAIGKNAARLSTAARVVAIGRDVAQTLATGNLNVVIGDQSANTLTTGNYNVVIGHDIETGATSSKNVLIGYTTAQALNNASSNVMIGSGAQKARTSGIGNIVLGTQSNFTQTGDYSTIIGNLAGQGFVDIDSSVVIGEGALNYEGTAANAQANGAIAIGARAGIKSSVASQNIFIGTESGESNSFSNVVTIGRQAKADANNQISFSGRPTPYSQLKIENYKFNIDQSVTAANDNHVLTYDNATGEIGLEAVAVQGANNGLQVTSNNVELGSGTNAASGTSADLTSNRYIPMNGFSFAFNSGTGTGVSLAANASSWASISARDTKENFEVLDYQSIYNNFRNVNIEKWNYKGSPNRQLGIMAEDFYEIFGKDLGVVHNHEKIETTDALGACMLLIKAQQEKIDELETRIKNLEQK